MFSDFFSPLLWCYCVGCQGIPWNGACIQNITVTTANETSQPPPFCNVSTFNTTFSFPLELLCYFFSRSFCASPTAVPSGLCSDSEAILAIEHLPGTGVWAAAAAFPNLNETDCLSAPQLPATYIYICT